MKNPIIPLYPCPDRTLIKSEGCYQYDANGKKYIDFESGVWCTNLGHSNTSVNEVIQQQIRQSIHHGYTFNNEYADNLALKLQSVTGLKNAQSVFLSSGSEAVNLAITIAQHLSKRTKILKINNSYLSAYGFGRLSAANTDKIDIPFNDYASIPKINFKEIAAFVVETGGASVEVVKFPEKDFIAQLIAEARKHNCFIIADEVTTGFGRMGAWFDYQNYNYKPDIVVSGKAMGNGYPVSAVTIGESIAKAFDEDGFIYAQSHQNDPLGCAIALEVIRIMEAQKIFDQCKENGAYFLAQLENIQIRFPDKVKEVRGRGLMLAIKFNENTDAMALHKVLFDQGFVLGCKANTFRFMPPLTIHKNDIDECIHALTRLLKF